MGGTDGGWAFVAGRITPSGSSRLGERDVWDLSRSRVVLTGTGISDMRCGNCPGDVKAKAQGS